MEVKRIIHKLLINKIYIRQAFIFFPCNNPTKNYLLNKNFNLDIIVSEGDLSLLKGLESLPGFWVSQFYRRLRTGNYKMIIATKNNNLCYFAWVAENCEEKDEYLNLSNIKISNLPYLFHCYTLPEYRGNNLHFLATKYILDKYAEEKKILWGLVYKNNLAAINIWKKSGLVPIKKVISYNFLSIIKGHKIVNI